MKKYLVLGGSGFIGNELTKVLAKKDKVIVADKFAPANDKVEYMYLDFVNTEDFSEYLEDVDTVIHLISTIVPQNTTEGLNGKIMENVVPTINLLDSMKKQGVGNIVFVSSGGTVYGDLYNQPIAEDSIKEPICAYASIKLFIENVCRLYNRYDDINCLVLRLSNPYGMDDNSNKTQGLIPILIKNILNDKITTIWGDGENVRDYIYIEDAVDAMVKFIYSEISNGTYNVGTGIGTSTNDVIDILINDINKEYEAVEYTEGRLCDVEYNVLDIEKTKESLGWEPKVSLAEGIKLIHAKLEEKLLIGDK